MPSRKALTALSPSNRPEVAETVRPSRLTTTPMAPARGMDVPFLVLDDLADLRPAGDGIAVGDDQGPGAVGRDEQGFPIRVERKSAGARITPVLARIGADDDQLAVVNAE